MDSMIWSYDIRSTRRPVFINNHTSNPADQVPWHTMTMLPKKSESIQATPTIQVQSRQHHALFDIDDDAAEEVRTDPSYTNHASATTTTPHAIRHRRGG
jgi:hypothetical protein